MTKIQKTALFSVPVLVGVYLIYRQFRKPKPIGKYVPPPTPMPIVTPDKITTICNYPLKKGVYNCELVKQVQWALNHIPSTSYNSTANLVKYRPLAEDGDFGAKTEAVLKDFWGDGTVQNETEMNNLMSYIVADPAAFQEAENPYIVAPTPTPDPTFDWGTINPR
jgi:hypothetical protein